MNSAGVYLHLAKEDGELFESEVLCPMQHLVSEFIAGLIQVVLGVIALVIFEEIQDQDTREKVGAGVPENHALVQQGHLQSTSRKLNPAEVRAATGGGLAVFINPLCCRLPNCEETVALAPRSAFKNDLGLNWLCQCKGRLPHLFCWVTTC